MKQSQHWQKYQTLAIFQKLCRDNNSRKSSKENKLNLKQKNFQLKLISSDWKMKQLIIFSVNHITGRIIGSQSYYFFSYILTLNFRQNLAFTSRTFWTICEIRKGLGKMFCNSGWTVSSDTRKWINHAKIIKLFLYNEETNYGFDSANANIEEFRQTKTLSTTSRRYKGIFWFNPRKFLLAIWVFSLPELWHCQTVD